MPNRLARESSPYLLQHANNPVEWYPWGDEAFAHARLTQRPIFLSIGYSTCHWCHVMEHESFESDDIASLLNQHFVSIKVDREERPDVDRVYMTFVQATTGSGGWPMSVWLTPELKPFYGGTYFPPDSRWGRPGFSDILRELSRVWRDERPRVLEAAEGLTQRLRGATEAEPPAPFEIRPAKPIAGVDALIEGAETFRQAFDARHGGFGDQPKFPRPSELFFLLREHARTGQDDVKDLALETLRAMALGGMRDHIGGGFHRYSVDAAWRVPHFEKMLYDQAQLTLAYLDAAQASGEGFYASVAEDTIAYVRREMTHPEGGFYSAEDADSLPPTPPGVAADGHAADAGGADAGGHVVAGGDAAAVGAAPAGHKSEGAFYIWSESEIDALLGNDAAIVKRRFGILPGGNAPFDPQNEFGANNLLYTAEPIADVAEETGRSIDDVVRVLGEARQRLFEVRARRPRPHLDDKTLTAWNGLMIAAGARAARVLDAQDGADCAGPLESAERAASFVRRALWQAESRTLLRRYREGSAAIEAYSEDYACLIWGLLELFQTTGAATWLEWAIDLQARQDELFWDAADGGWFNTTGRDPSVLLRLKEEYDGAEPAATSIAVQNLMTLAHLTGDAEAGRKIERTLGRFGPRMGSAARAVPFMMANLSAWHAGMSQVVIVGPRDREDTQMLRRAAAALYLPFAVMVPVEPGEPQTALARLLPWIAPLTMRDERATAYVCRNFACDRPVTAAADLTALLAPAR
jgi:uncharacterized protein YyaL (SSP411 family)